MKVPYRISSPALPPVPGLATTQLGLKTCSKSAEPSALDTTGLASKCTIDAEYPAAAELPVVDSEAEAAAVDDSGSSGVRTPIDASAHAAPVPASSPPSTTAVGSARRAHGCAWAGKVR